MLEQHLVTRDEVVAFYANLAGQSGIPAESLEELPPLLCHELLMGARPSASSGHEAFMGLPTAATTIPVDGHSIRWHDAPLPRALDGVLPLDGHIVAARSSEREAALAEACSAIGEDAAAGTTLAFTSVLVWTEVDSSRPVSLLTSASLPVLPHCTFLSDKAMRHIPPNHVFHRPIEYALRENLYHEGLHQRLTATVLQRELLREDYDARRTPKIPVPWRDSEWEPDRVLHAAFVYLHLLEFRRRAVGRAEPSVAAYIAGAVKEGLEALTYLAGQLGRVEGVFSPAGLELVRDIEAQATRHSRPSAAAVPI